MSQRIKVSERALQVGAFAAPLSVRRIPQARRIQLHLDPPSRGLVLTLPKRAPLHVGLRFVREKALWAQNRLALLPKPVAFRPGARLPVAGLEHIIVHRPDSFGGVWRERGMLIVTGRREHVERRIADWLKREALRTLDGRAREKAALLQRRVRRVHVRDTVSRWGSCSAGGRLSFSWRLILTPGYVLDYVVAHEVAHLAEMNHSERFWRLVERLSPRAREAKAWLRVHGERLHLFGANNG
jgi:predicted metal-dependent hydrolase